MDHVAADPSWTSQCNGALTVRRWRMVEVGMWRYLKGARHSGIGDWYRNSGVGLRIVPGAGLMCWKEAWDG